MSGSDGGVSGGGVNPKRGDVGTGPHPRPTLTSMGSPDDGRIWYTNDAGDFVPMEGDGTLAFGDTEIPIIGGKLQPPDTRFFRAVTAAEWDLIKRYDRSEFGIEDQ